MFLQEQTWAYCLSCRGPSSAASRRRRKSGQAKTFQTSPQKWVMDIFSFLKVHFVVRSDIRQLGKVGIPKQSEAEVEEEQDDDDDISPV